MNFTLREYQRVIYERIPVQLKLGPVLVQSPARSGKSKIIAATVARIIAAGKIPVVLTHRDKIQKQLIGHCNGVTIDAGVDHIFIDTGKCYIAMTQTLINRPLVISQLQTLGSQIVLIADEAHRGDFNKTFDLLPQAYLIGFTATPAWRWAKFMPDYYKSIIHGPQVKELIALGNITPINYYEMRNDLTGLKKSKTGEFTEKSQQAVFDRAKLYDGLFAELPSFQFKKCIVFCASKLSADALLDQFLQHGYRATKYYSGMKLGQYELSRFTVLDEVNVLVTVSALSEGFDFAGIDLNILYRATSSLPLFIQMGMRGATPQEDGSKKQTTVLDFGGNNSRFGGHQDVIALTMDRDWEVLWLPPIKEPKPKDGVGAIKNCPACEYIVSAQAKSCSNCGYIFTAEEMRLKEGELVKIQEDVNKKNQQYKELLGRRISTLSPLELAFYANQRDKKTFCARIAKAQEQKHPGWLAQYAEAIGYKPGWATYQIENHIPAEPLEFTDVTIKL